MVNAIENRATAPATRAAKPRAAPAKSARHPDKLDTLFYFALPGTVIERKSMDIDDDADRAERFTCARPLQSECGTCA
jgi:hypothetical protein